MENLRRIRGLDDDVQLPETIIQHIQSLLSGKEAVLTTVLSKSWYNSWLTRPDLDFDERDFPIPESQINHEFLNFVATSMRRYHRMNLRIENFKLWMYVRDRDSSSFANQLILKAVKMGVKHLTIDIHHRYYMLVLPKEVFEHESLITFSVSGCSVDRVSWGKVMFSGLKSLNFTNVWFGDYVIRDILATCPLIENLYLFDCGDELRVKMVKLNVPVFKKLMNLHLERVQIDPAFFNDFSLTFPCLENLTVSCCLGCEIIDISSHSLKFINLQCGKSFKTAKFDVPGIRKFKFSAVTLPSLSFTQSSNEWESNISLSCWKHHVCFSWFLELKSFLTNFSPSKITLAIFFMSEKVDWSGDVQDQDSPKPVVENFKLMAMMKHSSVMACSGLWHGLLSSFSPKFVTDNYFPKSRDMCAKENHEEFWEALGKRMLLHGTRTTHALSTIEGLEGVNVEFFEEACLEWKPMAWKTFVDASKISLAGPKIRFRLKWKSLENGGAYASFLGW